MKITIKGKQRSISFSQADLNLLNNAKDLLVAISDHYDRRDISEASKDAAKNIECAVAAITGKEGE